ncbi:uncharacterized protein [Prorops nasuta]|uniref:uncharacterized protein n=1 Tax=Prorops nasuta TaxID=863751 RepID=UPI0034CF0214
MPACSSENCSRFWSSSPPMVSRSSSASPPLPSSPLSTSPPPIFPMSTLKRSISNVSSSSTTSNLSTLSNNSSAPTVIFRRQQTFHQYNGSNYSQNHSQQPQSGLQQQQQQQKYSVLSQARQRRASILHLLVSWYLGLLINIFRSCYNCLTCTIWAPALWASAWVCLFWVILQIPLNLLKWLLTILHTPASERARSKRCVLISGGSTVQSVHLARNFYKAGAKVVICELEGLFGLARFSTACSKYYTLPRPGPSSAAEYVRALKDIVQREKAVYYIPVSSTSTAYYDALAKPHLELLGCECFVPSASDVTALDDPLELLRRCRVLGLPTPVHFVLRSTQDVARIYEQNTLRTGRHMMLAAGPAGMRDRAKFLLPSSSTEFRNQHHEVSETRPWVVVRDPGGEHYVTCTTIKESRIVSNVTCRVDESRGLIPEERPEVSQWLERFFGRSFGSRISGHLSFRLCSSVDQGDLVPIYCRVGVSLPYVCYSGIHPRLVWKPCRHFSRQSSGLIMTNERNFVPEAAASALKRIPSETAPHLIGTVLDKREALFVYWDPLPYCAYYHLQLPIRRVAGAIRAQPTQHNPPLAVVQ